MWQCTKCTLQNSLRRKRCAACNATRPKPASETRTARLARRAQERDGIKTADATRPMKAEIVGLCVAPYGSEAIVLIATRDFVDVRLSDGRGDRSLARYAACGAVGMGVAPQQRHNGKPRGFVVVVTQGVKVYNFTGDVCGDFGAIGMPCDKAVVYMHPSTCETVVAFQPATVKRIENLNRVESLDVQGAALVRDVRANKGWTFALAETLVVWASDDAAPRFVVRLPCSAPVAFVDCACVPSDGLVSLAACDSDDRPRFAALRSDAAHFVVDNALLRNASGQTLASTPCGRLVIVEDADDTVVHDLDRHRALHMPREDATKLAVCNADGNLIFARVAAHDPTTLLLASIPGTKSDTDTAMTDADDVVNDEGDQEY